MNDWPGTAAGGASPNGYRKLSDVVDELEDDSDSPPTQGVRSSWIMSPIEAERVSTLPEGGTAGKPGAISDQLGRTRGSEIDDRDVRRTDLVLAVEARHLHCSSPRPEIREMGVVGWWV